jgi:hypothetical protein
MGYKSVTDAFLGLKYRTAIFRVVLPIQSYPYRKLIYECMTTNINNTKISIYGIQEYIIHTV